MKQKSSNKTTEEQKATENIPSFSKRGHQSDEELIERYGAPLEYCEQCDCKRPVGHYPHWR